MGNFVLIAVGGLILATSNALMAAPFATIGVSSEIHCGVGELPLQEALNKAARKAEAVCRGGAVVPLFATQVKTSCSIFEGGEVVNATFECASELGGQGYSSSRCGPPCALDGKCPRGKRCSYNWNCFKTCM